METGAGGVVIRPLRAHDWPLHRAARLRALADSPDAFGSTLAEAVARPDAAWAARLREAERSGQDHPLVAEVKGELAGLLWAQRRADEVELFQVWVAPACRGRGVGAAMLAEALRWARATGAAGVLLDVTWGDSAAVRLYRRAGFREEGRPAPFREGSPLLAQVMRLSFASA